MKKRILAFILSATMLLGVCLTANAAADSPTPKFVEHHVTIKTSIGPDHVVAMGTNPMDLITSVTCDDGCELTGKVRLDHGDLSKPGLTSLEFTYFNDENGIPHSGGYDELVIVKDMANPAPEWLTGVSLDKTEVTVNKGEEFTLTLSAQPQNAFINEHVDWTISKELPRIDQTGDYGNVIRYKAVKAGTTTVTASLQGFQASCKVTVLDNGSPDNPSNPGGGNPTGPAVSYPDVAAGDWFCGAVNYVTENKLMSGYDSGYFGPADNLGRGQFATILYRMEGLPAAAYESAFPDVPEGAFYAIPAVWANKNQIITGYNDGRFGPADTMTREQLATMMYRYARYKGWDVSARGNMDSFPDAGKVTDYAKESVSWAVGMALITGDQGKVNPQGTSSRAVTATIIQRFGDKY